MHNWNPKGVNGSQNQPLLPLIHQWILCWKTSKQSRNQFLWHNITFFPVSLPSGWIQLLLVWKKVQPSHSYHQMNLARTFILAPNKKYSTTSLSRKLWQFALDHNFAKEYRCDSYAKGSSTHFLNESVAVLYLAVSLARGDKNFLPGLLMRVLTVELCCCCL